MSAPYLASRIFGENARLPLEKIRDKWTADELYRAVRDRYYKSDYTGQAVRDLSDVLVPARDQSIWLPYKETMDIPHDVQHGMIMPVSDMPTPDIRTMKNKISAAFAMLASSYVMSDMGMNIGSTILGVLGVLSASLVAVRAEAELARYKTRNGILLPLDKTSVTSMELFEAWEKRAYVYFRPKENAPHKSPALAVR